MSRLLATVLALLKSLRPALDGIWLGTWTALVLLWLPGWSAVDYHAGLVLTPMLFVSVGLWVAGRSARLLPVGRLLLASLLPLAVLALGDLWQVRCDRKTGLGFWLLGPFLSPFLAAAVARLAQLMAPRWPRATFGALTLALCGPGLWQFVQHPQVFGYGTPAGFVAGAIYEDGIDLHWGYLAFRLGDVAVWLPWLLLPLLVRPWRLDALWAHLRSGSRVASVVRAALLTSLLATAVCWHQAGPQGWRVTQHRVERALPIAVALDDGKSPIVVHLPAGMRLRRARHHAVLDVQARAKQMREWFGAGNIGPIHVFLYPNAAVKQRLMGARNVEIAKPWLQQVHLVLPEPGASVLTHELAHVYAGAWAESLLGVPSWAGIVPNALLIEGLAVAAEWPHRGNLDPHGWAAAMLQKKLAPPLAQLADPLGFFGTASDTAYTLAGSFLRWLADTHGKDALRRLYASGDWGGLPGGSLVELEAQWRQFLLTQIAPAVTDADRERALARFDRPGLFARPCLLATGRCAADAGRLWASGRPKMAYARWLDLQQELAGQLSTPLAPDLQMAVAEAQFVAGEQAQALAAVDRLLAAGGNQTLTRLQKAAALLLRGDLHLQRGDVAAAQSDWALAAKEPVSDDTLRTLAVKIHLARRPQTLPLVQALLAQGHVAVLGWPLLAGLAVGGRVPEDMAEQWLWARWRLRHVDLDAESRIPAYNRALAVVGGLAVVATSQARLDGSSVVDSAAGVELVRSAAARTWLMEIRDLSVFATAQARLVQAGVSLPAWFVQDVGLRLGATSGSAPTMPLGGQ